MGVKSFVNWLIYVGMTDQLSTDMMRKLKFTNFLTLGFLIAVIPFFIIFYKIGLTYYAIGLIFLWLLFYPIFYFNNMGWLFISRVWLITHINFSLGSYSIIFGAESGTYLLFILFIGITFMIFRLDEVVPILWSLILIFIFFYIVHFSVFGPYVAIDSTNNQILENSILTLILVWMVINFIYLSRLNKSGEDKLIKNEKKFKDFLEGVPDAIVILNIDNSIALINKKMEDVFGYQRDELIGQDPFVLVPNDEDLAETKKRLVKYFELSEPVDQIERKLQRKNGEVFFAEISISPLITITGKVIAASIRDVTEKKKNEKLRLEAIETAAKNKELEQFAYIVSHDIKEPIISLMSLVELFRLTQSEKLNKEALQSLEYMSTMSKRLINLIQDLLQYATAEHPIETEAVNCNRIIQEISTDLGTLIKRTKASIDHEELPTINANNFQIRLLFQNLINNAIKFQKQGISAIVKIGVYRTDDALIFWVKDNGIGMNQSDSKNIFDVFKRLHGRNKFEGSGIGLAHCKKIVKYYEGEIWVESHLGEGSTFYFTLPTACI